MFKFLEMFQNCLHFSKFPLVFYLQHFPTISKIIKHFQTNCKDVQKTKKTSSPKCSKKPKLFKHFAGV